MNLIGTFEEFVTALGELTGVDVEQHENPALAIAASVALLKMHQDDTLRRLAAEIDAELERQLGHLWPLNANVRKAVAACFERAKG